MIQVTKIGKMGIQQSVIAIASVTLTENTAFREEYQVQDQIRMRVGQNIVDENEFSNTWRINFSQERADQIFLSSDKEERIKVSQYLGFMIEDLKQNYYECTTVQKDVIQQQELKTHWKLQTSFTYEGTDEFTKYGIFELADMSRMIQRLVLSRIRCLQIDKEIDEKMTQDRKTDGLLEAKLGPMMGFGWAEISGWAGSQIEDFDFLESSISQQKVDLLVQQQYFGTVPTVQNLNEDIVKDLMQGLMELQRIAIDTERERRSGLEVTTLKNRIAMDTAKICFQARVHDKFYDKMQEVTGCY